MNIDIIKLNKTNFFKRNYIHKIKLKVIKKKEKC